MIFHQSQLAQAGMCLARLGYELKGAPRKTNSAAAYGSVMHHCLQVLEREIHEGRLMYPDPRDQRLVPHIRHAVDVASRTFVHFWMPANIEAICEPVPSDGWLPRSGFNELRKKGVETIQKYADLIRYDDHELLAIEFGFMVPIDGTWDDEAGEPHYLAGSVDRLAARHYSRKLACCIDDWKCLALGTQITMADGSRRSVEDVAVGDLVMGWRDGAPEAVKVLGSRDNGEQMVTYVRTSYGELVTTEEHPYLIDGDTWVDARDLQEGMQITLGLGTPAPAGSYDTDKAWALGVLVGDAYLGESMKITQSDRSVALRLKQALGPNALTGPGGPMERDYHLSNSLKPWLEELRLLGCHSAEKFIPDVVMEGGPDAWRHFLAGWLDTDGFIRLEQGARVSWSTISRELAYQGQELLFNLGVAAVVFHQRRQVNGQPYSVYYLTASNARGCSLLKHLLPLRGAKAQRLRQIKDCDRLKLGKWVYGQVQILDVKPLDRPQPTWALMVEGGVHVTNGIVTHNSGKEQTYLRHNLQFTGYSYASTKREFWVGNKGEDGFGEERGQQLFDRFSAAARRGTWVNLRTCKFQDAGYRGPTDYARFALAISQLAETVKADIFPLTLKGEACQFCDHRDHCGGTGLAADKEGDPNAVGRR